MEQTNVMDNRVQPHKKSNTNLSQPATNKQKQPNVYFATEKKWLLLYTYIYTLSWQRNDLQDGVYCNKQRRQVLFTLVVLRAREQLWLIMLGNAEHEMT